MLLAANLGAFHRAWGFPALANGPTGIRELGEADHRSGQGHRSPRLPNCVACAGRPPQHLRDRLRRAPRPRRKATPGLPEKLTDLRAGSGRDAWMRAFRGAIVTGLGSPRSSPVTAGPDVSPGSARSRPFAQGPLRVLLPRPRSRRSHCSRPRRLRAACPAMPRRSRDG